MRRTQRETIAAGAVGLLATVVVLAGASAQEAPPVSQPEPCDTVAEAPAPPGPDTLPDAVRDAVPTPLPTTTTSTLPAVPVETPTPATVPDTVPQMPCQTTTTTTLPPLDDDDDDEEYWDEFIAGVAPPGSVGIVLPSGGPFDTRTYGFAVETGPPAPAPVRSADTTDIQPIASGEDGFRYALVFLLPLLMLLTAAAVAWTLTQPVTVPAPR